MCLRMYAKLGVVVDTAKRSRNVGEVLLATALSAPLGFVSQLLVARVTTVESFGTFSVMMAVVNIGQVLATLDFGAATLRYGSRYSVQGRREKAGSIVRTGRKIALIGSLTMSVGIVLAPSEWFARVGTMERTLFLAVLTLASVTRVDQMAAIAVGRRRAVLFGFQVLRPTLAVVTLLLASRVFGVSRNASTALPLLAALIGLAVAEAWLYFAIGRDVSPGVATKREQRVWLKYAVAMMALTLASVVVASQSDLVLVALLRGAKEAGIYAASNQLASIPPLLGGAIATFHTREISAAHDTGRHNELRAACQRLEALLLTITVAGCLIIVGFGPLVLRLFGKDFEGGMPILIVLAVAHSVSVVFSTVPSMLLSLEGKQRNVLGVILVSGATSVGVSLLAAPILGAPGVAVGTLAGMLVRTTILRYQWSTRARRSP